MIRRIKGKAFCHNNYQLWPLLSGIPGDETDIWKGLEQEIYRLESVGTLLLKNRRKQSKAKQSKESLLN